jgi:hypothetical protein
MDAPIAPALYVCPSDSFSPSPEDPTVVRTNARGLRSDYFRRLLIFDSSGRTWKVKDVRPERSVTFWDRVFGRMLNARLICYAAPDVEMPQIVHELCSLVDSDPDDLYDQFVSHQELKAMFRAAASPAEVIDIAQRLGGAG